MEHYCHHCGKSIDNGNKFCPHCGALQDRHPDDDLYEDKKDEHAEADAPKEETKTQIIDEEGKKDLDTAIKVFMIIPTVIFGIVIFPLLWMVPMTIYAWKKADKKEPYGVVFSVCCIFLFAIPPVAGILMLIRDSDTYKI